MRETVEAAALCPNPFSKISCCLNTSPPSLFGVSCALSVLSDSGLEPDLVFGMCSLYAELLQNTKTNTVKPIEIAWK